MSEFGYYPGQIWEITTANGTMKKVLIVAVQNTFVNTIPVYDDDGTGKGMRLQSRYTVDPLRLGWTGFNLLSNPVCEVEPEELAEIKQRFAESIGVSAREQSVSSELAWERKKVAYLEKLLKVVCSR